MRKTGILLAISSLPNSYGIGDFSNCAYEFVKLLHASKCKIWQILPLNPLGFGNSPYQPYSSYAMDEIYIGLDHLQQEGLIKQVVPYANHEGMNSNVDYDAVRQYKQTYLKEAFENFKPDDKYSEFCNQFWVENYAIFIALKNRNNMQEWSNWPQNEKNWIQDHQFDLTPIKKEIEYQKFVQYTLLKQWKNIKKKANELKISIMGDIPFYVGYDSEDVWSNQQSFLLDQNGRPEFISGVPPDYFSATGQRWGTPIYNWKQIEETNFKFWKNRLQYNSKIFDIVRIDHFRAFDTFWQIPVTCPTAIDGTWIEAPGKQCLEEILPHLHNVEVVAEDLGLLRPEVLKLRDHFNFKGMNVVQFTFDPEKESTYENAHENMITYLGTHDNQMIKSWFDGLEEVRKEAVLEFLKKQGISQNNVIHQFIEFAMMDSSKYTILSMQDILKLDDQARMNIPSTIGLHNWSWRMKDFNEFLMQSSFIKNLVIKYNRD